MPTHTTILPLSVDTVQMLEQQVEDSDTVRLVCSDCKAGIQMCLLCGESGPVVEGSAFSDGREEGAIAATGSTGGVANCALATCGRCVPNTTRNT
jgi:hypothetical protein